ncbi:MAG: alpha/beta hydrolase [Akkermansia sp.]|nr:alpha/beta hydrolase [Akkermansia sp.]
MTSFSQSEAEETEAEVPSVVWKRFADGVELRAHIFAPRGHSTSSFLPGVLFLHGGMWMLEFSDEFTSWASHLAARGIVCVLPEYRTHARFDVTAQDIIRDGIDAWQWIYQNAAALGIDQEAITIAGTDAGGLMALNAAMQPMEQTRRWWKIGSRDVPPLQPAAVAIMRGLVDIHAPECRMLRVKEEVPQADALNPCALLRRYLPPLFCAHGMVDPLQDYGMREWFCEEWRALGNDAELVLCPHADHTLTHFEVNPAVFEQILLAWEHFMAERGIWPHSVVEDASLIW